MDVVDGKIVSAALNKRGLWVGAKRSPDCVLDGPAKRLASSCTSEQAGLIEEMDGGGGLGSPGLGCEGLDVGEWLEKITGKPASTVMSVCVEVATPRERADQKLSPLQNPGPSSPQSAKRWKNQCSRASWMDVFYHGSTETASEQVEMSEIVDEKPKVEGQQESPRPWDSSGRMGPPSFPLQGDRAPPRSVSVTGVEFSSNLQGSIPLVSPDSKREGSAAIFSKTALGLGLENENTAVSDAKKFGIQGPPTSRSLPEYVKTDHHTERFRSKAQVPNMLHPMCGRTRDPGRNSLLLTPPERNAKSAGETDRDYSISGISFGAPIKVEPCTKDMRGDLNGVCNPYRSLSSERGQAHPLSVPEANCKNTEGMGKSRPLINSTAFFSPPSSSGSYGSLSLGPVNPVIYPEVSEDFGHPRPPCIGSGIANSCYRDTVPPNFQSTLTGDSLVRAALKDGIAHQRNGLTLVHHPSPMQSPGVLGGSPSSSGLAGMPWSPPEGTLPEKRCMERAAVSSASYNPTINSRFCNKAAQSRSWKEPLHVLLRKELTQTDVGELGRIILPKKDAESQLPQLDVKEGKLLSMEDYDSIKHWSLRYKWWPNNKSRMYVLESTGEFVKFHDLKGKDLLVLYHDADGKFVIRGQKATAIAGEDPVPDPRGVSCKSTGRRSSAHRSPKLASSPEESAKKTTPVEVDTKPSIIDSEDSNTFMECSSSGSTSASGSSDCLPTVPSPTESGFCKLAPEKRKEECAVPESQVTVVNATKVESQVEVPLCELLHLDGNFWDKLSDPPPIDEELPHLPGYSNIEDSWGDCMQ